MNTSITIDDLDELILINELLDELRQLSSENFPYGDLTVIREHLEDALVAATPEEAEEAA